MSAPRSDTRLLLSMGLVPSGQPGSPLRPLLRELDTQTGALTDVRVQDTPPSSPTEHTEYTGAHVCGQTFVQTTRTSVLLFDWPSLALRGRISHPLMHDVHDALLLPDQTLAVTSSGLDSVLRLDTQGALLAHHWLDRANPRSFREVFGDHLDFRPLPASTFKPHRVHPNHLLWLRDRLWVTCLETRAFLPVDGEGPVLHFDQAPPHDGILLGDEVVFTTVSGEVCAFDAETFEPRWSFVFSKLDAQGRERGWCRAVTRVGERYFAGFSQLRESAWRDRLRAWSPRQPPAPTHITAFDPHLGLELESWEVGNRAGGTIYAITPRPTGA